MRQHEFEIFLQRQRFLINLTEMSMDKRLSSVSGVIDTERQRIFDDRNKPEWEHIDPDEIPCIEFHRKAS